MTDLSREQLLALLADSPNDAVLVVADDGTVTFASPTLSDVLGYDADAFVGTSLFDAVHPDDAGRLRDQRSQLRDRDVERTDTTVVRLKRRDGRWCWVESTGSVRPGVGIDGDVFHLHDVTESERLEAELRERVTHLEQAQELAHFGSWRIDFDTDELLWSAEIYELFGVSPAESMTYEKFLDHVHPDDRAYVADEWAAALDGDDYDIEHRIVVDGETRWVHERADVAFDADGDPLVATGVVQDVTERKEREAELRRAKRAIESSGHAIYITDAEGRIEYVNPSFEEISGYAFEEAIGKNPRILKSGEMSDGYYERLWETLLSGDVWEEELINRRADGELYHAYQTIAPIFDDAGEIDGFVANQSDITDRIEKERQLETLIHNFPGLVYRCRNEPAWPMDLVRGESEELVGYAGAELEAGAVSWGDDVVHPEDRDGVWDAVQTAIERDEPFTLTYRIRTRDGETKWVWEQGRPVRAMNRQEIVLEGVVMDVTERKRLEEDLRDSLQQMQVLDRVLRHNLHNDMNVVQGFAERIRESATGDLARDADQIVRASEKLLRTVDKEREITKLLAEPTTPTTLDLAAVAAFSVEAARERHPDADISVSAPDRAPVAATYHVSRAIDELVTNAVEHSDRETPTLAVSVAVEDDVARLRVADDGPPIPEMDRQVLTGEEAIDPLYHGSGLGLWLVACIVREAAGTLTFEENDPRGNVVTIALSVP